MWELAVVGGVAVLGVLGLILVFAKGEKSESKSSAVAKQKVEQAEKTAKVEAEAREVAREAPKTGAGLNRWLRRGVPRRDGSPPGS